MKTDIQKGLTGGEIEQHRNGFGYNELTEHKQNQFLKILGYFRGPILYVMEAAVLLAGGLQDWIDFGVIIGKQAETDVLGTRYRVHLGWFADLSRL